MKRFRKKLSRKASRRSFGRSAMRVKGKNYRIGSMRGGVRL